MPGTDVAMQRLSSCESPDIVDRWTMGCVHVLVSSGVGQDCSGHRHATKWKSLGYTGAVCTLPDFITVALQHTSNRKSRAARARPAVQQDRAAGEPMGARMGAQRLYVQGHGRLAATT